MSYLPPSSLYLHEPEPQSAPPEPHPDPHREPAHEAHLEPLRLSSPAEPAAPAAAPPHMYVTAPSIPHTIERIIDQPPPMLPRMPATGPLGPAITHPQHESHYEPQPHAQVPQPHVVEHIVERVIERPHEAPQVVERIVERIIERQPESPPPPQVVERIIERVVDRPTAPEPAHDVTPPAPTPAPVLTSSATPIHAVKGPKDWLVASPPAFLVEENAEPRRIHIEETQPDLAPVPIPEVRHEHREPHLEPRPEVRHEPRHEPKHETRHEPRHEPKPAHSARPETETRPAPKAKRHLLHRAHRTVMRHLTRDKSQPPEPGDKELLTLLATAFGAVCVGLMIWGAYNSLPRYGYGNGGGGLRADAGSRNVKVVNGEYGPGHYEPARPPRIEAPTVLTGTQPPMHLPPPPREQPRMIVEPPPFRDHVPDPKMALPTTPVERTLEALPRRVDPAIFVKANLGDTPMIRTWDNLAKYSMMLTALAVVPTATPFVPTALAQPPAAPAVDYSKQIADLSQNVKNLTEKVNQLGNIDDKIDAVRAEIKNQIKRIEPHDDSELRATLAKLQGEILKLNIKLDNLPAQAAPVAGGVAPAPANLARIESVLAQINDTLQKNQPNQRLAMAPPENLTAPTIAAKTARIVFVNLYNKDLYLWVNDKKHKVDAQKTITVENVAPGAANIEVKSQDAVYHRVSPNLLANETYTLTAR